MAAWRHVREFGRHVVLIVLCKHLTGLEDSIGPQLALHENALLLTFFGLVGAASGHQRVMAATPSFVAAQFVFTALAYATLTYAFVNDDFSVAYVAANSNSLLPWYYKFSAVWGAH